MRVRAVMACLAVGSVSCGSSESAVLATTAVEPGGAAGSAGAAGAGGSGEASGGSGGASGGGAGAPAGMGVQLAAGGVDELVGVTSDGYVIAKTNGLIEAFPVTGGPPTSIAKSTAFTPYVAHQSVVLAATAGPFSFWTAKSGVWSDPKCPLPWMTESDDGIWTARFDVTGGAYGTLLLVRLDHTESQVLATNVSVTGQPRFDGDRVYAIVTSEGGPPALVAYSTKGAAAITVDTGVQSILDSGGDRVVYSKTDSSIVLGDLGGAPAVVLAASASGPQQAHLAGKGVYYRDGARHYVEPGKAPSTLPAFDAGPISSDGLRSLTLANGLDGASIVAAAASNVDASPPVVLGVFPASPPYQATFSRTGARAVLTIGKELYVAPADGGDAPTHVGAISSMARAKGDDLAWASAAGAGAWLYRAETGTSTQIAAGAIDVTTSPDGATIAYRTQSGQLWVTPSP
jgi:hypothetical protein